MIKILNIFLITIFCCEYNEFVSCRGISGRIMNGSPIQTVQRFPHYVEIETRLRDSQDTRKCSGSIIKDQWILTTASCVRDGLKHRIFFRRLHTAGDTESYSVDVSNSRVYEYPTGYDDLALVQLPVKLQFDKFVNAIPLAENDADYKDQLVVLPGSNSHKTSLAYGMFRAVNIENCQNKYDEVDEFLHLCTESWINRGTQSQYPCEGDQGSGLIVGWPKSPKLIGIFSFPLSCERDSAEPAVHIRLSKYVPWIYTTIENAEGAITPNPTTTTTPATTTSTEADTTTSTTTSATTTTTEADSTSTTTSAATTPTTTDTSTIAPSTVPDEYTTSDFTTVDDTSTFATTDTEGFHESTTPGAIPGNPPPCVGNECY